MTWDRTRAPVSAAAALALLALGARPAVAQSLGDLANKEKERRKTQAPAKVYTEDDLRKGGHGTFTPGEPEAPEEETPAAEGKDSTGTAKSAAEPASKDKSKEKSADELRADAQKAWREALGKANAEVERLGREADEIQAQLDDLRGQVYTQRRQALVSRLEQTRAQLEAARRKVEDLQEQGRRQAFRP